MKFREMGASKEFIMVAQYDYGDDEVNTARMYADRVLEKGKGKFDHFGEFLWEGNLYKVVAHADPHK